MKPIKEPENIDFSKKSEPLTKKELSEFRKIMQEIKSTNHKLKKRVLRVKDKKVTTS